MNFRDLKSALFDVGRVSTTALWYAVRNNFIQHEARIQEFEALTNDLPPGFILGYAPSVAPSGYVLCDGSLLDRTTYADLFAVIGTRYNTGGETGSQFRVPDWRGRIPIGAGAGTGLTARSSGNRVGAETHVLSSGEMPSHTHALTPASPQHRHGNVMSTSGGGGYWHLSDLNGTPTSSSYATTQSASGTTIGNTGGGGAHNNVQPSFVINFIIKT